MVKQKEIKYVKKYKCPFCELRIDRVALSGHINKDHSEMIPEGWSSDRIAFNTVNKKDTGYCVICREETKWNEQKRRYDRICEKPKCQKQYKELVEQRLLAARGVTKQQMMEDPEFQAKMLANRKISGTYKFSSGGTVQYVGSYEKKFLEFMDLYLNIEAKDIQAPGPTIEYYYEGKKHTWITDFYYIPYNLVLDIKDGGQNPNTREMKSYRAKQIEKEKAIRSGRQYNYLRLTDNQFDQLIEIMLELKESLVEYDGTFTRNIMQVNPIVRVNESSSTKGSYTYNKITDPKDIDGFEKCMKKVFNTTSDMSEDDIRSSMKTIKFNNKVIGYIGFSYYDIDDKKYLGLGNFMILPEYQCSGHGTGVVEDIISKNKSKYDEIYCYVDKANTKAINFYKKIANVSKVVNKDGQYYVTIYKKSSIDESYVSENMILNKKDLEINLDKFESGEKNILLVTGFSGSGKSTLARSLASKYKCANYELDCLDFYYRGTLTRDNLIGEEDGLVAFIDSRKLEPNKSADSKEMMTLYRDYLKFLISWCKKQKDKKFIIEGLQIYEMYEDGDSYITSCPMIIKGTSGLVSAIRAAKRNDGSFTKEFGPLIKWALKDNKALNKLKKDMNESTNIFTSGDFSEYREYGERRLKEIWDEESYIEEASKYPEEVPEDIIVLLKQLNSYDYGYIKNGKKIKGTKNFFEDYKSLTISEFEKHKIGVCWDYVHYEADWFKKHGYKYETFYIQVQDEDNDCPSHTYLVFYLHDSNKVYYFESSWGKYQGIEVFDSVNELHNVIKDRHISNANSKCDPSSYFREKYNADSSVWEHLTCGEYMVKISKGRIKINESYIEEASKSTIYHLSKDNLDGKILSPRIPSNFFTKNGYEDGKTKRVCFSKSIDGSLRAMSMKCKGMKFYVHVPEGDYDIYTPTVEEVPDCKITGEVWIKKSVKLKCIGLIEVIGDKGEDGIPYTYGNHTAELYDWEWKWVDKITESTNIFTSGDFSEYREYGERRLKEIWDEESYIEESNTFKNKLNKKQILQYLKNFKYPTDEFIISFSSALVMHGVKDNTNDIDLCISKKLCDRLVKDGYPLAINTVTDDKKIIINGRIEAFVDSNIEDEKYDIINGFKVRAIEDLRKIYSRLNRDKDKDTIRQINDHFANSIKVSKEKAILNNNNQSNLLLYIHNKVYKKRIMCFIIKGDKVYLSKNIKGGYDIPAFSYINNIDEKQQIQDDCLAIGLTVKDIDKTRISYIEDDNCCDKCSTNCKHKCGGSYYDTFVANCEKIDFNKVKNNKAFLGKFYSIKEVYNDLPHEWQDVLYDYITDEIDLYTGIIDENYNLLNEMHDTTAISNIEDRFSIAKKVLDCINDAGYKHKVSDRQLQRFANNIDTELCIPLGVHTDVDKVCTLINNNRDIVNLCANLRSDKYGTILLSINESESPFIDSIPANVDTIVFDLGGVLVEGYTQDYLRDDPDIPNEYVDIFMNAFKKLSGPATENCTREEYAALLAESIPEQCRQYIPKVLDYSVRSYKPFPYTENLLSSLKSRGYKLYYLSNWSRWHNEAITINGSLNFLTYFIDGVFSWKIGHMKPDKEIYTEFLAKCNITDPSSLLFFDDKEENVQGAINAGMQARVFTPNMVTGIVTESNIEVERITGHYHKNGTWGSIAIIDGQYYRNRVETLVIDNDMIYAKYDEETHQYKIPGGSAERIRSDKDQAIAECREEARLEVKNIKYTGIDYLESYPNSDPTKINYPHTIGSYNKIFIAAYAGKYEGPIREVDKDPEMLTGKWYKIADIIDDLKPEWADALGKFMPKLTQVQESMDDFDQFYLENYI